MNAYELADDLEGWCDDVLSNQNRKNVFKKHAKMLRQQADRIAELESCLDFALQDTMDYITLNNLDGENNHWLVWARKLLVNKTPQTKPLSDGVILNSIQHPRNDGYVPEELNSDSLEMVEIDLPCILTIDEIHNLFGITALNPTVTLTWEQCEKIARAIEERHGIK